MRKLGTFAFCAMFVATSLGAQTAAIRANGLIQSDKDGYRFPDGTIQTTAASGVATLKRTIIVSPVPGNPTASGTALLAALASITGNDASNPWLLKIEPGIYDLGAIEFQMKSYVDVEGSGENTTIVRGARGAIGTIPTFGIVRGAANAQLRMLSVVNNAPIGSHGIALYASGATGFSVRDTTVICNARIATGIAFADSHVDANRVQVFANGGAGGSAVGISSEGSSWISFVGDVTADGSAGANVATGVSVSGTSNETIISESKVLIVGPVDTSYGVRVLNGVARIRGSAILVSSGTDRYGVTTAATLHAIATIQHSRIVIGNVWNDPGVGALNGGKESVLRLYSSYVDGPRIGEALCVYAFTSEGPTSCPAPAP